MRATRWLMVAALGVALLTGGTAWAGELQIGAEPLEVDDNGKLTKAARDKTVTEVESSVPGDELWLLHLWARIDGAAAGPLYLEFYRDYKGKTLMAHRIEYAEYGGEKFFSMDVEISRSEGFRTGETVQLAFVQNVGGRDVKKAKGKVTLLANSKPPPEPEEEAEEEPEDDEFAGPDEPDEPDEPAAPQPPPIEKGDKKGCTIGAPPPLSLLLLLAPAVLRRRR